MDTSVLDNQKKLYRILTGLSARSTDAATRGSVLHVIDLQGTVQEPIITPPLIAEDGTAITYNIIWKDAIACLKLSATSQKLLNVSKDYSCDLNEIEMKTIETAMAKLTNQLLFDKVALMPVYLRMRQWTFNK